VIQILSISFREMEFGDFDDDFFDSGKAKKASQDFSDEIRIYRPKIVTSKVTKCYLSNKSSSIFV
jgi:hypothetical protein